MLCSQDSTWDDEGISPNQQDGADHGRLSYHVGPMQTQR